MSCSAITFNDRNPVKRWLQRRRLVVAVNQVANHVVPETLLDFGAGNGELCKLLAEKYPKARILCYEPTPRLLDEARENLSGVGRIEFFSDVDGIPKGCADVVFCLEVFEHLPEAEMNAALGQINGLLRPGCIAVIGVPVETGIPALYKGLFRMARRFGAYDANPRNILLAAFGRPPVARPVNEIAPGFNFHSAHMGFDHRYLKAKLSSFFELLVASSSPTSMFGTHLNPEAYFVVRKTAPTHGERTSLV